MSEQINKVLASTAQSFDSAQQAQARANIAAIGFADLNYSSTDITGIGGSAIGGGLGEVYHDNNLTGSGTSASPLGVENPILLTSNGYSSWYGSDGLDMSAGGVNRPYITQVPNRLTMTINGDFYSHGGSSFFGQHVYSYPNYLPNPQSYQSGLVAAFYENDSAASILNAQSLVFAIGANGIGGGVATSIYRGNGWDLSYSNSDGYIHQVKLDNLGNHYENLGNPDYMAVYGFGSAIFSDNSGATWESIDASSIRQWRDGYTKFQSLSAWATAQGWNP